MYAARTHAALWKMLQADGVMTPLQFLCVEQQSTKGTFACMCDARVEAGSGVDSVPVELPLLLSHVFT